MTAIDPKLMAALGKVAAGFKAELAAALERGDLAEDAAEGCAVASMLRGIDRIAELPDDRALSQDEEQAFQAALVQVAAASIVLLDILPLPAIHVTVASFHLGRPQ